MKNILTFILLLWSVNAVEAGQEWQRLFDGKSLDGWIPKFAGYPLGVNFKDTFRVEDGVLKASYDQYDRFRGEFGHLFYKAPASNYRLRMKYRFLGEQVPGGPEWAFRNSGVMIHSQTPDLMALEQPFPLAIEVQFLGQTGAETRPTGNLCTPGTNVIMAGKLVTEHCIFSTSPTFPGNDWVTMEVEVRKDGTITHFINEVPVLTYNNPQIDQRDQEAVKLFGNENLSLTSGYIALQAESHPVEFRNIEIQCLDMTDCLDLPK